MDEKKIPQEEATVQVDERLWAKLDSIEDSLKTMSEGFARFQENVEGRMSRFEEKCDELKAEQEHAKSSRSKIFERIETEVNRVDKTMHEMEHRMDQIEVAPALEAAAGNKATKESIRDEIVRNLARGAIWLVLILVLLVGSHYVIDSNISALLPKEIPEVTDE